MNLNIQDGKKCNKGRYGMKKSTLIFQMPLIYVHYFNKQEPVYDLVVSAYAEVYIYSYLLLVRRIV